jgi:hypothetical protein
MQKTQFGVTADGYSPAAVRDFESIIGSEVDTVLGYGDGSNGWEGLNPGWLVSPEMLGGTGRNFNISIVLAPDDAGVAEYAAVGRGEHVADDKAWAETLLAAAPDDGSLSIGLEPGLAAVSGAVKMSSMRLPGRERVGGRVWRGQTSAA